MTIPEIEEMLAKITPGEWSFHPAFNPVSAMDGEITICIVPDDQTGMPNPTHGNFIAAAPQIIRQLLAQVKVLIDESEHMRRTAKAFKGQAEDLQSQLSRTQKAGEALALLDDNHFTLHTCDAGYRCLIYTEPENGEQKIGDAISDTISEAVKNAVTQAQNWQEAQK